MAHDHNIQFIVAQNGNKFGVDSENPGATPIARKHRQIDIAIAPVLPAALEPKITSIRIPVRDIRAIESSATGFQDPVLHA